MKSLILIAALAVLATSPASAGAPPSKECKSYTDFWSEDGKPTTECYNVVTYDDDYAVPNRPARETHTNNTTPAAPAAPCSKGK